MSCGEAAASAVGFLLTAHLPGLLPRLSKAGKPIRFDEVDSGGSTTQLGRFEASNYDPINPKSGFCLKELSSRSVMCGGHELTIHMMELICEKIGINFNELKKEPG
eukprot:scaffold666501_cov39-Prasinocladus_malaysianus.AAC.1